MPLKKYKEKRSFNNTPEPEGGKSNEDVLHFVVQKHDASRLHYDFRLEMEGVLKSWAVPKGPSTDPKIKRLAMMVEDHPYDYKNFEGIIPKGNYGAGTVIVWDEGAYEPIDDSSGKKEQEKSLIRQLKAGSLKFKLHGKKLKGSYALVKTKGMGENAWLLIKHNDKYASDKDITARDKSVISGKNIEKMAVSAKFVYGEKGKKKRTVKKRASRAKKTSGVRKKAAKSKKEKDADASSGDREKKPSKKELDRILDKAPRKPFPEDVTPMLATLVDEPFDDPDWEYEVKWDGYRALVLRNEEDTGLKSRNSKSFEDKFYPVYEAVKKWRVNAIADGEIVAVDDQGISHFNRLQNWRSEADGQLLFYVFDLLWYEGRMLTGLPLEERLQVLKSILPKEEETLIRYGFSVRGAGKQFFSAAQDLGLEGIMAKKLNSKYEPGNRSGNWLKIKIQKRQEAIIVGYTRNDDSPKLFSSLMLGAYDRGKLKYVGKVGTGFNQKMQQEMMKQFVPLVIRKSALQEIPDYNKASRFRPHPPHATATWLKPELVCEISFREVTEDGVFRHPSFKGMRMDKDPKEVVREKEKPVELAVKSAETDKKKGKATKKPTNSIIKPPAKGSRRTLLNPSEETHVRKINRHDLKFTHLSKIFWPDIKVTKRDVINYYYQTAPLLLPYLKNRPQSLNRHPDGIKGESFYQKDVTGKVPEWIQTYLYHSEGDDENKHFLVVKDEATLLYMAALGCIEINPWSSTVKKPDHPSWCIIDLDPDKHPFERVVEAAQVTRQVLDEMGITGYPKTSGSTGMHIYIPLNGKYTYEESKTFARLVVGKVHEQIPEYTTIERIVSNRKGKMYLDFLQNRPQATIAAPYSLRPRPGAPVSMPLHWEEVKRGLKIKDFTIFNALERIRSEGDIFKPVLGKGMDLKKILKAATPDR